MISNAAAAREALERFPRVPLGRFPTPVEPLEGIGAPSGARIFVKREDLSSPLYGGNKVRKLELLLTDGGGPIVAFGGTGSHHVLATAVHAASLGRPCTGILVDQPRTAHTEAVFALNAARCAEILCPGRPRDAFAATAKVLRGAVGSALGCEGASRVIAPGGSSPLGTLGWVGGGLELAAQMAEGSCPAVDEVYVAYGSGGTAVGLALGLALAGAPCEVVAVRVATRLTGNDGFASLLARRAFALLARRGSLGPMPRLRLRIEHGFAGPGYGHPTAPGEAAMEAARPTGVPLEPTYTAKALAALLAAQRRDPGGRARLFLDTYAPIDKLGSVESAKRP